LSDWSLDVCSSDWIASVRSASMTGSPGFPTDGRHAPVAVDDTSAATTVRTSDRQALRHGTGEANRSEVTGISGPEDRGLRATFADPAQDAAADNGATTA